jgi:hypothetical protein
MGMFKMNDTENLSEKAKSLQELLASQQTLLLSTASESSVPDLSKLISADRLRPAITSRSIIAAQ